jgi:hypothetical protein
MTMTANGRADIARPRYTLGNFLKERMEVEINGQVHLAWITTNRGYPRRIRGALDRARVRYLSAIDPIMRRNSDPGAELSDEERDTLREAIENAQPAYDEYLTTALMLLIPTLDEETAEMIDQDRAEEFLTMLGYFNPPDPDAVAEAKSEDDAEASPGEAPLLLTKPTSPQDLPTGTTSP